MASIDVVMLTLDAENFLEKSIFTIYREIPIKRLIVCDGGSKDGTVSLLNKYPRVQLHVRPDLRTTGKALEFLFSLVETQWFVCIDSDLELAAGWYDEMQKNTQAFDVIESARRILAYHMYREDVIKQKPDVRSLDLCHLIRKSAVEQFHCDDDFMWRYTDILLRQVAEKSNHKYGKVTSSLHVHNETERLRYESDNEKNFQKVIWREPEFVILDQEKAKLSMIKNMKAVVKYLDPDISAKTQNNDGLSLNLLDRDWVVANGPKWLKLYDQSTSLKARGMMLIRRVRRILLRRT